MTDYKSASSANGFGNRIGWGKRPALLLIDVCTAYWTSGSPLDTSSNPASVASLDAMKALLAAARSSDAPVIWTTVRFKSDMSDAGLFFQKSKPLSIWSDGDDRKLAGWVQGLEPTSSETVIEKRFVCSSLYSADATLTSTRDWQTCFSFLRNRASWKAHPVRRRHGSRMWRKHEWLCTSYYVRCP